MELFHQLMELFHQLMELFWFWEQVGLGLYTPLEGKDYSW